MKICKDCVHYQYPGECLRKVRTHVEPVDGRERVRGVLDAYEERTARWLFIPFVPVPIPPFWACGKRGRYWEQKPENLQTPE